MNLLPGETIPISDQRLLTNIGGTLNELIDDYERRYAPLFADIKTWWRNYEAVPLSKEKNFPFKNAPLARDTEVLTIEGWRRVDEIGLGEQILTRRDGDGTLQWKPVLATPEVHATELIHFQSNSVDQMVTPEHTMVTYTARGELKRRAAKDIFNKTGIRIPLTGSGLDAPCPEQLYGLPAGDVMEFIGWYLAEGWHNTSRYPNGTVSKGTLFISQSRVANPEHCRRLEALFTRLGFGWNYMKSNQGYSLYARDVPMELRKHLYAQGSVSEKYLPTFVYRLGPDLLWRLMTGLVLGDGCLGPDGRYSGQVSFYSTSKKLADGFQTLSALVGYRATISERPPCEGGSIGGRSIVGQHVGWIVRLCTRDRAKLERCAQKYVPYNDTAYCVTVENHAIYVRRNGVPSWTGNSNVVIPLAQLMTDTMVARTYSAVFSSGHRVWTTRTENDQWESLGNNMARYINWQADGNDFSLRLALYDWIQELTAIGSSVIAANWRDDVRHVFVRKGTGDARKVISQPVRFARGPLLEHVPREQMLWDTAYRIGEAPAVIRELRLQWHEVVGQVRRSQRGRRQTGWYPEQVAKVTGQQGSNSPGEQVRVEKDKHDSIGSTTANRDPHDIRECHVDWSTMLDMGFHSQHLGLDDAPLMPLVLVTHRKTREILHIKAEPYFTPRKPFFDGYFHKRSGRGHSVGMVKRQEPFQLGMTTIFNQGVDAQTRANSIWAKTKSRKHLESPIDPSAPIYDPGGVFEPLAVPGASFSNIQLVQLMQAMSERSAGQADPAFGRETRMGGHPAPATSTLALMQQGDTLSEPMRDQLRTTISDMGEFIAVLDQQFEMDEDGRIARILGEQDGEIVKGFLFPQEPIPGNYQFNVRGLSQDLNPDTQMQRAITITNMNQNYWAFVLKSTQALIQLSGAQGQMPEPVRQVALQSWIKSIQGQTTAHIRFLEAADVDDIEKFTLALERNEQQASGVIRQLAEQAAGQAGPAGGAGQPGVGSAAQVPAGIAPGLNGGTPPAGVQV